MSCDPPLVRQWMLLRRLCSNRTGSSIGELAEEFEVSQKTIRRDLNTLAGVGFPISEHTEDYGRKRWRITSKWNAPLCGFRVDEALSLYMGRQFLEPLAGTVFWQAAQSAYRKLRSAFDEKALAYLEKAAAAIHHTQVGVSDYSQQANIIDELMIGIEDRKAVFITYQSLRSTEALTYDIHPYGMAYHKGSLYVVGFSCQHDALRHWKVDRMEDAEATQVAFQRPDDFSVEQHRNRSRVDRKN